LPILLSLDALERLLAATEDKARRQILTAVIRVQRALPLSQLERALLAQNLDEAVRLIGLEPVLNALAEVQSLTADVRNAGWFDGLKGLPRAILARPMLDLSLGAAAQANPLVLDAMQRQNLRRIQAITAETEAAIRATLARGIQSGTHPREVAKQLRQSIGLTVKQAAGVDAFRARLVAQDRDPAQVERMVDRFARRQLTTRAETIAITETMAALQQGKRAQWDRLTREGVLTATDWEIEWVTANDERVCPICAPLDGRRASLGQPIDGLEPPAHPRCRCLVRLILAGFRKGEPTNIFRRAVA
jgi:SPP1 gp7 family putative phage head morphogenesis protein